ncbi:hypothetical protein AHAS_Ahas04G0214800 [Arachis hypogaea]
MERDHLGYYSHPSSDSYYCGWRNYQNFGWQSQKQRNFNAPCSNYQEPSSFYPCQEPPSDIEVSQKKGVMEVETLNAILVQNKLMTQQINLLTQQMSGMQVPAINTQNPLQEASTLISGQVASTEAQVNEEPVEKDCKDIQLRSGKVAGSETKVNKELVEKESYQEEQVEIEKACKEVEEFKEEHKGVELARPLPKPLPSNTTFNSSLLEDNQTFKFDVDTSLMAFLF